MNIVKREININTNNKVKEETYYSDTDIELGNNYIIFSSKLNRDYLEYRKLKTIILISDSNNSEILKPNIDKESYIYLKIRKFLNKAFAKKETLFITTKSKATEEYNVITTPTLVVDNTLVLSIGDEYEITY